MEAGGFLDLGNLAQFSDRAVVTVFLVDEEQLAPPLRAREDRLGWTPVGQEVSVNGGGDFS